LLLASTFALVAAPATVSAQAKGKPEKKEVKAAEPKKEIT
jgi:hypothetical protein